jgi:DNA repair protein RecO (recombination protein O)
MKYKDSSRILTFYSKEFGKITGIVKGARQAKSRFGAALDPLSHVAIILYRKETREIQTVTGCEVVEPYRSLREDLDKMSLAMQIVEIHNCVTHPDEPNPSLFKLLVQSLSTLNAATSGMRNVFHVYEYYLAHLLGVAPVCTVCVSCGRPLDQERGVLFIPERGGTVCEQCGSGGTRAIRLTTETQKAMSFIGTEKEIGNLLSTEFPGPVHDELDSALWLYLQSHLPGLRKLRSRSVFGSMLATE